MIQGNNNMRKTRSRPTTPLRSFESTAPTNMIPMGTHSSGNTMAVTRSSKKFHPKLILSQIVAFQSLHYLILCILFQLNSVIYSSDVSLERIFTARHLDLWTNEGRLDAFTILLSSLIGAVLLAVIVEKSKKCLDFSITLFFVHCILCWMGYGSDLFSSTDFWIVHVLGMIVMVVLGEYLCSKRELMEIPLL